MLGTEPRIREAFVKTGLVKLQFNHMLDFGAPSEVASQAAECAGDQRSFWKMHDALFANQDRLWDSTVGVVKALAQEIKLDAGAFNACMDSGKYLAKVRAQDAARKSAGVRIRPTFDINGQRIQGAANFDLFQQFIQKALGQ